MCGYKGYDTEKVHWDNSYQTEGWDPLMSRRRTDQTSSQTIFITSPSPTSSRMLFVSSSLKTLLKLFSDTSRHINISLTSLWHFWNLRCIICYFLCVILIHFCYLLDPYYIYLVSWRNYCITLLSCCKIAPAFPHIVSSNQLSLSPVHISRSSWFPA